MSLDLGLFRYPLSTVQQLTATAEIPAVFANAIERAFARTFAPAYA